MNFNLLVTAFGELHLSKVSQSRLWAGTGFRQVNASRSTDEMKHWKRMVQYSSEHCGINPGSLSVSGIQEADFVPSSHKWCNKFRVWILWVSWEEIFPSTNVDWYSANEMLINEEGFSDSPPTRASSLLIWSQEGEYDICLLAIIRITLVIDHIYLPRPLHCLSCGLTVIYLMCKNRHRPTSLLRCTNLSLYGMSS